MYRQPVRIYACVRVCVCVRVGVCVCVCLFTQSHNAGRRGRKTQGQAEPSECSLAKCQAHSDHRPTEMSPSRGSKEAKQKNCAQVYLLKVNARQIFIIATPSGHKQAQFASAV